MSGDSSATFKNRGITYAVIVLGVAAALFFLMPPESGSSDDPEEPVLRPLSSEALTIAIRHWNEGNDALDHYDFKAAEASFAKVAEIIPNEPDVWSNLGISRMNQDDQQAFERAKPALRRAIELQPKHPYGNHALGVLLKHLGEFKEAEQRFRTVLDVDPHDPTANYYLATILLTQEKTEEAERRLRAALAAEPHQASALFGLFNLCLNEGKDEQAEPLIETFRRFEASETGNKAGIVYSEMGRYGDGVRNFPLEVDATQVSADVIRFEARTLAGEPLSPSSLAAPATGTFDEIKFVVEANTRPTAPFRRRFAGAFGPGLAVADIDQDGDLDLHVSDGLGLGTLWINKGGVFAKAANNWGLSSEIKARSVSATFGDFDNDGLPDLYVACAGPNYLFHNRGQRFEDITARSGTSGGDTLSSQACMADLDADGDVDIYCAQLMPLDTQSDSLRHYPDDFEGAPNQLFMNTDRQGGFVETAEKTSTSGGKRRSTGVIAADLDGDHDADLLVFNDGQPDQLFRNDRIWRFAEVAEPAGLASQGRTRGGIAFDLNLDGRLDLVRFSMKATSVLENVGPLRWSDEGTMSQALKSSQLGQTGTVLDLNLDGHPELLTAQSFGGRSLSQLQLCAPSGSEAGPKLAPLDLPTYDPRSMVSGDFDGDGDLDVAISNGGAAPLLLVNSSQKKHEYLAIKLKGDREDGKMRANTGGIGARVRVVAGTHQQVQERLSSGGVLGGLSPLLHFGLGKRRQADYVSVNWPDDLLQGESQVSGGQVRLITQVYRKSSSCPLLFAWNGQRMDFVTDFLGTGGLGFFISPGVYAQPDPTEWVAIPDMVAKDGYYELSIHEPMEEICYLDQAQLIVTEHSDAYEVWPDERLVLDGQDPTGRLLAILKSQKRFPKSVVTLAGNDDPKCLSRIDRKYQSGVKPDRRFMGYAAPQEITLDFGDLPPQSSDRKLCLFIQGWVEYPYSHVNFAAYQAGAPLQALSLDYEDSTGHWKVLRENFGYPAGMPRVMTLDIDELPRSGTGKLRLRTNLEMFIDAIWLAEDHGEGVLKRHVLSAAQADLRHVGYPREYSPDGREPLLYDYGLMDPTIDFKTMSGNYTRLGDVRPLLNAPDDRYVIIGRGEEVFMRFKALPKPPAGTTYSFTLKSDGWCKDMDLYTAFPSTVEPLPFHGMSRFPYPPNERYPQTPAHLEYRKTWNTRRLSGR